MTASDRLFLLYEIMIREGDCVEYLKELCSQLTLLGTETNTLTKQLVLDSVGEVLRQINKEEVE